MIMKNLFLLLSLFFLLPTVSPASQPLLDQIDQEIVKNRIFEPSIKFRLDRINDELLVSSYRSNLANLKDMKINALLISESILKISPALINKVNVYYFDQVDNSKYWCAIVPRQLMSRLREKSVDKNLALKLVKLYQANLPNPIKNFSSSTYTEITEKHPVSEGFLKTERLLLEKRIVALKYGGIDVSRLESLFLQLDDAVRREEDSVQPLYLYLLNLIETKEKHSQDSVPSKKVRKKYCL